jgi:hypothetical protein
MPCPGDVALFLIGVPIFLLSLGTLLRHPWLRGVVDEDPNLRDRQVWITSARLAAGVGVAMGLVVMGFGVLSMLNPCR